MKTQCVICNQDHDDPICGGCKEIISMDLPKDAESALLKVEEHIHYLVRAMYWSGHSSCELKNKIIRHGKRRMTVTFGKGVHFYLPSPVKEPTD